MNFTVFNNTGSCVLSLAQKEIAYLTSIVITQRSANSSSLSIITSFVDLEINIENKSNLSQRLILNAHG